MMASAFAYLIYALMAALVAGVIRQGIRDERRRRRYREWEESMIAEEKERRERERLDFEISETKNSS